MRFDVEDDYDEPVHPRPPRPHTFNVGQRAEPIVPSARPAPPTPTRAESEPPPRENGLAGMVFVPTEPLRAGAAEAELQLRRMQDGRLALLAYTSLDLLVAGCGPHQGWIAAPAAQLTSLHAVAPFDVIAVDVELPDDWRVEDDGYAASGVEGTLQ